MSSEWPRVAIQDIAEVKSGKRLPLGKVLVEDSTPFPYIRLVDVSNGKIQKNDLKFLTTETRNTIKRYVVNSGDVCLAIVGHTIGMVFYVDPEWDNVNLTENAARVTNFSESVNSRYLYYYLISPIGQAEIISRKVGSAQGKLPLYNIRSLNIPIPTRMEQDFFVEALDTLSLRIDLLRETNTTLEGIAQAMFKSWFVDFDPVHAKQQGRAPEGMDEATAALFPDSFEESELGLVPRGWKVGKVVDIGEVICGKTPPTSEAANYGDDVPFITIPDMHNLLVITSTNRSLSTLGANTQKKKTLPPGSICVSCIATAGLVARVTIQSQTNQQINSVVPLAKWGKSFPLFTLRRIGDAVRAGGSGGSIFHNLNKSGFEQLKILFPSELLALVLSEFIEPIIEKITANQLQTQSLATLRDTLLPRLISGQLRLPEAEAVLEEATA